MPRLRLLPRAEIRDTDVERFYETLFGVKDPATDESGVGPNRTRGDYWASIAHSPATVRYVWDGFKLNHNEKLPALFREIGMTRAGWAIGSKFVYSQHCKSLRKLGWPEEKIEAVPCWQTATCFDATERALFAYADDLVMHHGRVPEARFELLRTLLSDQEIVEFTHSTLMYMAHAVVCRALRVEYDDVDERVSEVKIDGPEIAAPGS